jgi:hypothetical protein
MIGRPTTVLGQSFTRFMHAVSKHEEGYFGRLEQPVVMKRARRRVEDAKAIRTVATGRSCPFSLESGELLVKGSVRGRIVLMRA